MNMTSGLLDNILIYIKFILYLLFLFICSFFAAIETALLKYTASKFEIKEKLLSYIDLWERKPENILGSILVGTNLACVGIGVLSESLKIKILYSSIILLVFGEILPKIFALNNPQKILNFCIKKLIAFSKLVAPISKFLVNVSLYFTGLFLGIKEESPLLTKEELKDIIAKDENVPKDEKFIYSNMLELVDKRVYDVMAPKENIFAIDVNMSFDEIIDKISKVKYSRIPVYKDNLDNIVGVIYTKDIILAMQNKDIFLLEDLLREPYFVVNTTKVVDVLRRFKEGEHHMAIVVDEYGSTVGLVTIEDIIEEIVGEIYDEYDIKEEKIKLIDKNTIVVMGDENIKNIEEVLGIKLADEEVATIGGYVATKLGCVPTKGEKVELDGLVIDIIDSTEKVIKKIKISKK